MESSRVKFVVLAEKFLNSGDAWVSDTVVRTNLCQWWDRKQSAYRRLQIAEELYSLKSVQKEARRFKKPRKLVLSAERLDRAEVLSRKSKRRSSSQLSRYVCVCPVVFHRVGNNPVIVKIAVTVSVCQLKSLVRAKACSARMCSISRTGSLLNRHWVTRAWWPEVCVPKQGEVLHGPYMVWDALKPRNIRLTKDLTVALNSHWEDPRT